MRTAMFHPHGSPMRSEASSASRTKGRTRAKEGELLPLIDCPQCKVPVVKLRSKKRDSYRMVFYKCPNNFPVRYIRFYLVFGWRLMSGSVYNLFIVVCIRMTTLVVTIGGKVPMSSICRQGK